MYPTNSFFIYSTINNLTPMTCTYPPAILLTPKNSKR